MKFEDAAYRVVSLGCESENILDKEAVDIILTAAIAHNQSTRSSSEKPNNCGLSVFPTAHLEFGGDFSEGWSNE